MAEPLVRRSILLGERLGCITRDAAPPRHTSDMGRSRLSGNCEWRNSYGMTIMIDRSQPVRAPPDELLALLGQKIPPQRAFPFNQDHWLRWVGHLDGVDSALKILPAAVDRRTVARTVESIVDDNPAGAFVISMVWGHGRTGYGPSRTATILHGNRTGGRQPLDPTAVDRLRSSAKVARELGAVEGFRYLNNRPGKLAGLGPAFFTKWLFFVTARGDVESESAAPILDRLVIKWMASNGIPLRSAQTSDYARYVELLRSWGSPHSLSASAVEERIFRTIRNDG